MEAFTGTILPWSADWAPVGWMVCKGQLLQVQQYQALFSLLGINYGGDGQTTFGLPNLQGRFLVGLDTSSQQFSKLGMSGGQASTTLTADQVPLIPHMHPVVSTATVSGGGSGTANVEIKIPVNTDPYPNPMPTPATYVNTPGPNCTLGTAKAGSFTANIYTTNPPTANANLKPFNATATYSVSAPTVTVNSVCSPAEQVPTKPIGLMPAYQVINYIICLNGNYPNRP